MSAVGFINPGPSWTCFPAKAWPSRRRCERRATPGPAQKPNDRPEERSNLRPKGLAKEEQRPLPTLARLSDRKASLPTPARLSDQKAWPTTLQTPTRVSDRGYTEPLLTALLRLA